MRAIDATPAGSTPKEQIKIARGNFEHHMTHCPRCHNARHLAAQFCDEGYQLAICVRRAYQAIRLAEMDTETGQGTLF